jgi:hypothetical protein
VLHLLVLVGRRLVVVVVLVVVVMLQPLVLVGGQISLMVGKGLRLLILVLVPLLVCGTL